MTNSETIIVNIECNNKSRKKLIICKSITTVLYN